MAGGGLPDIFGALGGGLSSLAGSQPSGGGGAGGGFDPNAATPANAPNSVFTDPLVGAQAAVTAGDPTGQGRQQPADQQQSPTFTKTQDQLPGGGMNWTSPANLGVGGGPPTPPVPDLPPGTTPLGQLTAQTPLAAADANTGISPETSTGLTPQAEIAAGYRPPEATDADLAQAAQEQGGGQGAIGASSVNTDQQQQNQQKQQNPLQAAGRFLKNVAKQTPGGAPARASAGFNPIQAIADLLTKGPAAFAQDLQGLTNQVGSAYEPQNYGSQGGARGYGYGAGEPPAQAAVPGSPQPQQPPAPQPPTPPGQEAQTAQAEQTAQDPGAAAQAGAAPVGTAPVGTPPAQTPATQQASYTTGVPGQGTPGQGVGPVASHEIRARGSQAPPMRPSQPNVNISPLRNEANNDQLAYQSAQMISQEVGVGPKNRRAQIIQLETARNRALYGIQGNGRYPNGAPAPRSVTEALQTVNGPTRGRHGYYPYYGGQRVNPAAFAAYKREVWDPVMKQGSNLSDVGWGPMTGNASDNPRAGERGMVATHQYRRGTLGYDGRPMGGDQWFRENLRPGDRLPTMNEQLAQRASGQADLSNFEDVVNAQAKMAPGGVPWQDWRRSTNVEQQTGAIPMDASTSGTSLQNAANWMAGRQSPDRATLMAAQAGSNDLEPLLNQLARQWAQQTMSGQ